MTIKTFEKLPVRIQAIQFFCKNGKDTTKECLEFAEDITFLDGDNQMMIDTLEGFLFVNDGDWIVKGVEGEFYPCKPDIFEKTYKEVIDI